MLIGDMAIRNLAPRDANSGGRIIKNMRICGSGLYEYHRSEAALMGLDPDKCPGDTFKIFRSPEVLVANKDLYARVPIITGHHVRVNTGNAKRLAVGMVGDTVQSEVGDDGETYLYTTGTIIAGDGIEAYEKYGELSVGYDPIVEWCAGDYKGQHYDAVLKGFNEINHLLICQTARGGHQCMIMDECPWGMKIIGGKENMKFFSKIFGGSNPKAHTMAGDAAVVSVLLDSIAKGADSEAQIKQVREIVGDCKDKTWNEYLDEMSTASKSGAPSETIANACKVVADYYKEQIMGDEDKEKPHPKDCNCDEDKEKPHPKDCNCKKEPETDAADEDKKETGDSMEKMVGDAVAKALEDIDNKIAAAVAKAIPTAPAPDNAPVAGDAARDGKGSDDILAQIYN